MQLLLSLRNASRAFAGSLAFNASSSCCHTVSRNISSALGVRLGRFISAMFRRAMELSPRWQPNALRLARWQQGATNRSNKVSARMVYAYSHSLELAWMGWAGLTMPGHKSLCSESCSLRSLTAVFNVWTEITPLCKRLQLG